MPRWTGAAVAAILIIGAIIGMMVVFTQNASPYVNVEQAKSHQGENLHLAGDIIKPTMVVEPRNGLIRFDMTDLEGEKIKVVYTGAPPANMGSATRVVAVGGLKGDEFHAHKLLVKCPSKYEGVDQTAQAQPTGI